MSLYYKPRKTWRLPRVSRGLVFSVAVLTLVVGAAVDALNQRTPIGDSPTPIVTAPQVAEPIVVSEYMRYYNIGHTAYKQGEYLTAWLNFGSALEAKQGEWTNGDNVTVQTVYYLRGKSAEKLNLLESALKDYDIAANYYGDAAARQMYENLEARLLTMKNAMGTVDFNADATDANMLAYESSIAIDRHDYALANEMLNQAIDLEPNNTYFLNMRAYNAHLLDSHDHAAALADYNRVIELDPTDAYAYMGRGHALSSLGQYQEAWRSFEKAVQLEPEYYGTYLSWGLAYQRMGDDLNAGDMFWRWFTRPEATFNEAAFMNERATLILHEDHVYLMSIPVRAGQVLNVVAGSDNPFTADPTLVLLDPSGTPVAGNDDRISDEDFSAALTNIQITEDGIYTLAVSHAGGGSEGEVRVEYQLENGFVGTRLSR